MKNSKQALNKSIPLILCLALVVGLLGASAHLLFWLEIGEIVKYDNGHDESQYLNYIIRHGWNELYLSWLPLKLLTHLSLSSAWIAIFADILWPMVVVLCAALLALQITKDQLLIFLFIILYVFGVDLLSFNSTVLPQNWTLNSLLGNESIIRQYFVSPFLTFIQIFRSPEPQASLVFLTCHVAALLAYAKQPRYKSAVLLFIISTCTAFSYPFYALTSIMLSACFALSLLLIGDIKKCIVALLVTFSSFLCVLTAMSLRESVLDATVYNSHLPAFSLSIGYGILATSLTLFSLYKRGGMKYWVSLTEKEQLFKFFGVLCLLLPVVTLNQQIVTGKMVLLTHWEKLINYNLLVIGLLLVLASSRRVKQWMNSTSLLYNKSFIAISSVFLVLVLVSMTLRQYQYWAYANVQATAYAAAIKNTFFTHNAIELDTPIFIDKPTRDQLLKARFEDFELQTMGYSKVLQETFKLDTANTLFDLSESLPQIGFENAARMGLSKEGLIESLQTSIDKKSCWPYLAYFFSVRDCSPLQSTYRNYQPERLLAHLSIIYQSYETYLQQLANGEHNHAQRSAIVVKLYSEVNFQAASNRYWRESLIHTESLYYDNDSLLGLSKRFWPSKTVVLLQTPNMINENNDRLIFNYH